MTTNLGIMYRREYPPEDLIPFAKRAEELGFDEIWVVEDCFYASGVSSAAAVLASTNRITVGLGIMPAVVRNPVFTAMEIGNLERMFPGRFLPGIGHGVAGWMHQIGAFPKSQMKAIEEVTVVVKRLLKGEEVNFKGQHVQLDAAKLVHPPDVVPPISFGVVGPKSLQLSGRVADGTILSEYSSPKYIAWAKEQIAIGRSLNPQTTPHRLTIFGFASAAGTTQAARDRLRPMVAAAIASKHGMHAKLTPLGILEKITALKQAGGQAHVTTRMPDKWIDQLTIAGTPGDWQDRIDQFSDLGADSVVLVPLPDTAPDELETFAGHLFRE